jgi:hypothetical protein
MPERATVFELTQIGVETTPGTTVAATKKLLGTSIDPSIRSDNQTFRPKGSRYTTVAIQNKEWVEATVTQDVAVYTDTVYLLSSLLGPSSISLVSIGVYLHEWDPLSFTPYSPKTFTVENGSYVRAMEFGYGLVTGLNMDFSRDGVSLGGSMVGQLLSDGSTLTAGTPEVQTASKTGTVSAGTFTISFMGETTTAIAFGATNATVLAALEALANIAPGDVVLGGGPLNTTPVTITFGGAYASADIPLMVIDSALLTGGGSYGIVQTTAGAALSELALQPIAGDEWDFYIDTTSGGIGGTKLLRCFAAYWTIENVYGVIWPANTSNTSWAAHVDLAPTAQVRFTLEADSAGMAFRTQLQTGDTRYVRIKCTGPALGASTYYAAFDFAVKITAISEFRDQDGVYAIEYTADIVHDSTWGKALSFDIRNSISAIS